MSRSKNRFLMHLPVLMIVTVLVFFLNTAIDNAYAMGQAPSTCTNRYDGAIISAKIVVGNKTYDPINNQGVTFQLVNDKKYTVAFTVQIPGQNSQGNSLNGTTWYSTNAPGFALGECVSNVEHDQNVTVVQTEEHPANLAAQEMQSINWNTFVTGFSYKVNWTNPAPIYPSPPQNLGTISRNSHVILSWLEPSNIGNTPIIHYDIYRGGSPGSETLLKQIGNLTNFTDNTMSNDETYYYYVKAENSVGKSIPSNEVEVYSPPKQSIITVKMVDMSHRQIFGYRILFSQDDLSLISKDSPAIFTVNNGQSYTIKVPPQVFNQYGYGTYQFDHWTDNQSPSNTRMVTVHNNLVLVAVYR